MVSAGFGTPLTVALLTTDDRESSKDYGAPAPKFGQAPEALIQGFALLRDVRIHVVSCVRAPVHNPPSLKENVYYSSVEVPKVGWLTTGYQGCIRSTRRRLRQIGPDIVHGQGTEKDCAMAAVFSGYPNVLTIHGNMRQVARALRAPFASYHWFTAHLETLCLKRAGGVFCNSRYTQALVQPPARRTWPVPNALRLAFFETPRVPSSQSVPHLLHIGTVCEYKQQLEMLDLVCALQQAGLEFEFTFVGNANPSAQYASRFLNRIAALPARLPVRHLKSVPVLDLIKLLDSSSALVHTPVTESFGLVVAEALSRNIKVFGFKIGGVIDILEEVPDAVMVPNGNWSELGNAISGWLRAGAPVPAPTSVLARARYHPAVIATRHVAIYREILANG